MPSLGCLEEPENTGATIFKKRIFPSPKRISVLSTRATLLPSYEKSNKRKIADLAAPRPVNGRIERNALRQQVCGVKVFAWFERT